MVVNRLKVKVLSTFCFQLPNLHPYTAAPIPTPGPELREMHSRTSELEIDLMQRLHTRVSELELKVDHQQQQQQQQQQQEQEEEERKRRAAAGEGGFESGDGPRIMRDYPEIGRWIMRDADEMAKSRLAELELRMEGQLLTHVEEAAQQVGMCNRLL